MKNTLTRYSFFIFLLFLGSSERIFAQQGFGTKEPSKASVVDMQAENRGLLVPRVALTSLTSFLPVTGETSTEIAKTNSLLVYNTADVNEDVFPGFYYWTTDGVTGQWNRLVISQDISATTASNGLTKTSNNIKLGGELENPTTIVTDNTNTLAIQGLQTGNTNTDKMMVVTPDGVIKTVKQAPRIFYMPPVIFDTSTTGNNLTRNLYQDYVDLFEGNTLYMARGAGGAPSMQYTGGLIKSSGAPDIPIYEEDELWFYVIYYDTDVFAGPSGTGKPTIDANGVLSYSIIGTATEASYMTIAFSVRD